MKRLAQLAAIKQKKQEEEYSLAPPRDLPSREEEVRCAKTWEEGVDYEPDQDYPIVMKPSANCSVPIGDKIAYIGLPTDPAWLKIYIDAVPRYRPVQMVDKDGIFTWMLYRKAGSSEILFAATQVTSVYEIGTLHRVLAKGVGAKTVHGAGELKKIGKNIVFNFLSGSYVLKWIGKKDKTCTLAEMENYIEPMFRSFFPGFTMERNNTTFITDTEVPTTMQDLQLYADAHFIVCVHDKGQKENCMKVNNSCENPLKPVSH